MQNVLLLSAGVTTGWHLAKVARQYFADDITLHLCDINPRELVPAATLTGPFHRVRGTKPLSAVCWTKIGST